MHSILSITTVVETNKSETSAFAGEAVLGYVNITDIAILFKYPAQVIASGTIS